VQSISFTYGSFAALKLDGSVITWGYPESGGDSSSVADQLTGVQSITANYGAFAAIKADGSVITWGNPSSGGGFTQDTSELEPDGIVTLQ
ncbi:MAG: hypothetical protein HRU08_00340, partial [Oleispira sp.]|nr:hypothetical protein [Oleispira sp.]